ncbi:PREDICTED: UDP-glucuronosyltransferase 2B33-like [Amphimedon queenslandica]|uniref:UDP-glucuronosyltransferase n=1 Tax=Amphimedon queenslandica TaxID=400682 RepID=A0A1X7TZ02_AMPQE|nr:PREDICTED: UDP-glucuronosyltransferase 2B33-like [Amphimedon queenslandica]|eukprot:XP_011406490.1 PREDICTED: UDP-glucuronosyltransferase 2B33-like [Amphimedon queenslandica]
MVGCLLLLLFACLCSSSSLDVLLVSAPFPGHANRLLAIGEELVVRGHNVTFSSLDNWVNLRHKSTERGIRYLSAGKQTVTQAEWNNIISKRASLQGFFSKNPLAIIEELRLLDQSRPLSGIDEIAKYFMNINLKQWDIIVTEHYLLHRIPCIAKSRDVTVVITSMTYFSNESPPWPFPVYQSGYSDNLSFKERAVIGLSTIGWRCLSAFSLHWVLIQSPVTESLCKETFKYPVELGWEVPYIIMTVLGLEYPRTISPLTTYVGPVLSQALLNQHSLPVDLNDWLRNKNNKSVIYISMGSQLSLSDKIAQEIVNGISDTDYHVIWSVGDINKDIILNIDSSRYYTSSWIPQVTLLQHSSISMAILHGGSNGIHESLYFGIPIIVIPGMGDQFDWAVRVSDAGVGLQLLRHEVTSRGLRDSIRRIDNDGYHKRAEKMSVLMKRGGGVKRAAELVEFYGTYGYDHLIPGPIKYKWNWIQYYNVDVYIVLLVGLVAIVMILKRSCKCCTAKKTKTKQN